MNNQEILDWISNETMRNQVYHDHKENMAWVATALYISGAFILGWQFRDINACWQKAIVIIIAVIITGLVYWFVCWQFNNRGLAASRVKKLIETAKHYLPKDGDDKLAWYFKCVEKHEDDPNKTMVISLVVMGVVFTVFLLLVCC